MLLNDAASSNSYLGSADASDFYLGADLPSPESIKIHVDTFDSDALDQLNFTPHVKTEPSGKRYACCDVLRSTCGLGCSGLLSHLRLLAQLYSFDYIQTDTPCLFRHATRDIAFCLCVDDFNVRYSNLADWVHAASS